MDMEKVLEDSVKALQIALEAGSQSTRKVEAVSKMVEGIPGANVKSIELDWKKEEDEEGLVVFLPTLKLETHKPKFRDEISL